MTFLHQFCFSGLKVNASQNVFLENLHNTNHLETMYYVTDNKQVCMNRADVTDNNYVRLRAEGTMNSNVYAS